ncbi:carboxylesterase family protein [Novosphingobium profundi]|uniref:carboxylesterase/lipase family protein n=1 Tax=Novosphingobium profundi TaxID=1774954 RepID=UPI001BDA7B63|nr:carboxylesterase family protein [Novosphingobium profundi]MBT0671241.1 carboxylesterase family protein [Novosphingobium profundi]
MAFRPYVSMLAGLLILASLPAPARAETEASLAIEGGRVALPAPDRDGVRAFKGLPYAAPPIGPLRWRPPAPVIAWKGRRPVAQFGPDCLQTVGDDSPASRPKSEDCLFLNVWTSGPLDARKPVFVWIHGGGSRVGSGAQPSFDGAALARRGIVVVTINYRLGAFGFLSTRDLSAASGYGASGNYGFMDDIAALGWVRRNIARFGGDPTRVTVGGESAGSVATSVLMASPEAHGLFQRAIGESGSALRRAEFGSMGATSLAAEEEHGARLMAALGVPDAEAARHLPAQAVLEAALAMKDAFHLPVVDGKILPDAPLRVIRSGHFNDVPLLAGWNHDEGSFFAAVATVPPLAKELETLYGRLAGQIAPLYPVEPGKEDAQVVAAIGHHGLAWPTWIWAESAARSGTAPVYVYQFEQAPKLRAGAKGPGVDVTKLGVYHGAEVPYVFGTLDRQTGWTIAADDHRVSGTVSRYWVNFITNGDPNEAALPTWPAYRVTGGHGPMRMTLGPLAKAQLDPDYLRFSAIAAAHEAIDPPLPSPPIR